MSTADIRLKSADDIKRIKESGEICAEIFRYLNTLSLEGMSTWEVDSLVDSMINRRRARSAFKTLRDYDYSSCISIDDEVAHGIPSKKKIIASGNLVKIDIGVVFNGYFADACRTFSIGEVSNENRAMIAALEESFNRALAVLRPGNTIEDIGNTIAATAEDHGFTVLSQLTGHGVGFALHESPRVPHYRKSGQRLQLTEGMVFALEPALSRGADTIITASNGFTIMTGDGATAVQHEESIAVTSRGPLLLTGEN